MENRLLLKTAIAGIAVAMAWNVSAKDDAPPQTAPTTASETKPADGPAKSLDLIGIHNAFSLGEKIYSGSCPEGEAGFRALAEKGVKTVISVDGARPDEKWVVKYGMRYVHIPVHYSGITRDEQLTIARAVRDLPGPVFIHCHHGIHRGPTAAVIAAMATENWSNEEALAAMKQAGTAPNYTGLWADARQFKKPTKEELDKADATFPAAVAISSLAEAMVSIDERWEHIRAIRAAAWSTPRESPDLDPPHEALMLREDFRELHRAGEKEKRPADYLQKMAAAELAAQKLEDALRGKEPEKAQAAFEEIGKNCKSCHANHRDVPAAGK
jgi:protein tyrosine phosphatase (PTP) superfamily phosphohydrolase (DUF442 family)